MTKAEFLARLTAALSQLPAAERERAAAYYSEMIDDRMEDGMDEAAAVAALGAPEELARQALLEQPLGRLMRSRLHRGGWTALQITLIVLGSPVWLSLAVAFFAVIAAVYISIWAVIVSLWAAVASLGIGGLAAMTAGVYFAGAEGPNALLLCLGAGLVCLGLGLAMALAVKELSALLVRLTGRFLRAVKSLFVRKERA